MTCTIIDVSTQRPGLLSMANVHELRHSVVVDDGADEWRTVTVLSTLHDDYVTLTAETEDARLRGLLEADSGLQTDCYREWQERFESEACDGNN